MRPFRPTVPLIFFLTLIILPYSNCGFHEASLLDLDASNLSLGTRLSVVAAQNQLSIPPNVSKIDLVGACDVGAYVDNTVYWVMETPDGTKILDSYIAGGAEFLAQCESGLYSVSAAMPCPGLSQSADECFGLAAPLKVYVYIQAAGGAVQAQSLPIDLIPQ